jgi:hypothetical protein
MPNGRCRMHGGLSPGAPKGNKNAFFGFDVSGTVAPAVAEGFYSFIPGTLAPGHYQLKFGGVLPINNNQNIFKEDITYNITVTP